MLVKREIGLTVQLIIALTFALLFSTASIANQWANTYGRSRHELAARIRQTSDGGYILAGNIELFCPTITAAWVMKLDDNGSVLWQKAYGGLVGYEARSIQQTLDNGYIITGAFKGKDSVDAWVSRLDGSGNVLWAKSWDVSDWDYPTSIQQTADGGFIVLGVTNPGSDFQNFQSWVLKFDGSGNILWQKKIVRPTFNLFYSIRQTSDGGYIAAGVGADIEDESAVGGSGAWVLKFDGSGNILWHKVYSIVEGTFSIHSIQQTSNAGYITAGTIASPDTDSNAGVLKLDGNGNVLWQKTYGGPDSDSFSAIQQTSDGGYILTGNTKSFGDGVQAAWVLKLDVSGDVIWQKIYYGSNYDTAYSIQQTSDGGFVVAGQTDSFGAGDEDAWVLKLNESGAIADCSLVGLSNAEVNEVTVTANYSTTSVQDLALSTNHATLAVIDTWASSTGLCWELWEERFDVIDWLDRARICLEWPSEVGMGYPQRCPPRNNCIYCRYTLSKYLQPEKIPDFLFNIYDEITPILSGTSYPSGPEDTLRQLEKHFGKASVGSFYNDTLKASIIRELKSSKKITPQLLGKIVEGINAIELDAGSPPKSEVEVKAGKFFSVDFDGVAWVTLSNVKKSGKASLEIKGGIPSSAKGMHPLWPIATYEFKFNGALAKDGYIDINFYIGGINFIGKASDLRLLEWDGKHYRNVATHIDTRRGIITGRTDQLSTYVIMSPALDGPGKLNCSSARQK